MRPGKHFFLGPAILWEEAVILQIEVVPITVVLLLTAAVIGIAIAKVQCAGSTSKGGGNMLKKILGNKRGDMNIQYLGIAAVSVTVLLVVVGVAAVITGKWEVLKTSIETIATP